MKPLRNYMHAGYKMGIRDTRIYFDCDYCATQNVFGRPKSVEIKDKTLIVCEVCYNNLKGGIS